MSERLRVCVDFDGVLHDYCGEVRSIADVPYKPVRGAIEWLRTLLTAGVEVSVYSRRSRSTVAVAAIHAWLLSSGLTRAEVAAIELPDVKPTADVYVDDRAWRFEGPGSWPTLAQLDEVRDPWWRR